MAGFSILAVGACGDTAGDPIDGMAKASDVVEVPASEAVLGLCEPCLTSSKCGDGNDLCLLHPGTKELFCGRDCAEGAGCPSGYQCVDVRESELDQCVPSRATCAHRANVPASPGIAELRALALEEIHRERELRGLPSLAEDTCLNDLALASANEVAAVGAPFTKFERECAPVYPDCSCSWASEQALVVVAYGLTAETAILGAGSVLGAVQRAFAQPGLMATPEIASDRFSRIGLGIIVSGDEATFSFTYAP